MSAVPRFARRTDRMRPSAIRELLKLTQRSDVVSLAGGLPSPDLFPTEAIARATERVMVTSGAAALQYGPTPGLPTLRAWIASTLPGATVDAVQVTSGSQQGLDLMAKILVDPGDAVAVAAPCYMGALRAFDPYEPTYLPIESDHEGALPDSIEAAFARKPKFAYVIPDFDNPAGTRTSLERRRAWIDAAARHDVLLIEDAPYRELRFGEDDLPTLFELDPSRVVHAGSLSKTLAPGLRVAWLVLPEAYRSVIERAKQACDLQTGGFVQAVAAELVTMSDWWERLGVLRSRYRERRDVLASAVRTSLGEAFQFHLPPGGMFLWGHLPQGVDASDLLPLAVEHGVAYVPGESFYPLEGPAETLRLSFSQPTADELVLGADRLASALRAYEARAG